MLMVMNIQVNLKMTCQMEKEFEFLKMVQNNKEGLRKVNSKIYES